MSTEREQRGNAKHVLLIINRNKNVCKNIYGKKYGRLITQLNFKNLCIVFENVAIGQVKIP